VFCNGKTRQISSSKLYDFSFFTRYYFSNTYNEQKHKALILKQVPCILKYMACIFRNMPYVFSNDLKASSFMSSTVCFRN